MKSEMCNADSMQYIKYVREEHFVEDSPISCLQEIVCLHDANATGRVIDILHDSYDRYCI